MPLWNRDDFVVGGIKGILDFDGTLVEVEEEMPGKFDNLQDVYHFSDVVVTNSEDEVILENNELTSYHTHSRKRNSTAGNVAEMWMAFCEANGLSAPPESLYGQRVSWHRETFDFGPNLHPGWGFVPVKLLEPMQDTPQTQLSQAIIDVVLATAADGATRDLLRRELTKKASLRQEVVAAGGIDAVLAQMVETYLSEEEGVYTTL